MGPCPGGAQALCSCLVQLTLPAHCCLVLSLQGPASCSRFRMPSAQLPQQTPALEAVTVLSGGTLLSHMCLILFLPHSPALPDCFSKNKSSATSFSPALSQFSPQGGGIPSQSTTKSPLELLGAAAQAPGWTVPPERSPDQRFTAPPLRRAWAWCVMLILTFFFLSGVPFLPSKTSFKGHFIKQVTGVTPVGAGESYWVAHAMGVGPRLCPGTLGEILASSRAVSSHSQGVPSLHEPPQPAWVGGTPDGSIGAFAWSPVLLPVTRLLPGHWQTLLGC